MTGRCGLRSARARPGVALLIALVALLVVAMLGAISLDASLQDLRLARGGRARVNALGLAESALSPQIDAPTDSAWLRALPGSVRQQRSVVGRDTVVVSLVRLGGRFVRASSAARSRVGGGRGDAGIVAFLFIVADTGGGLSLQRLPGWWWAPDP